MQNDETEKDCRKEGSKGDEDAESLNDTDKP